MSNTHLVFKSTAIPDFPPKKKLPQNTGHPGHARPWFQETERSTRRCASNSLSRWVCRSNSLVSCCSIGRQESVMALRSTGPLCGDGWCCCWLSWSWWWLLLSLLSLLLINQYYHHHCNWCYHHEQNVNVNVGMYIYIYLAEAVTQHVDVLQKVIKGKSWNLKNMCLSCACHVLVMCLSCACHVLVMCFNGLV